MNMFMMTDPELPNSEALNTGSIQLPVKSNFGNANQYYLQGLNPCLPSAYVSCQQVEEDGQPSREKLILSLDDGYSTDGRSNSAASTSSPISTSISCTSTFEGSPISTIGNTSSHQDHTNEGQIKMHRDPIEKGASMLGTSRSTVGKHKALHAKRRDVLAESPETTFSLEERLRALTTIEEEDTALQDRSQYRFPLGHSVNDSLARLSQSLASSPLNARHNKWKVVNDRQSPSTSNSSTFAHHVQGCYRAVPIQLDQPLLGPNSSSGRQEANLPSLGAFAPHSSSPLVNGEGWKDYAIFFEKETDIPPHNIDPAGKGKFTNASVDDVPDMDINRLIGMKTNNRINKLRFRELGDQTKQNVNQSTATNGQSRIMGVVNSEPHQLINKAHSVSVSGIGTRQRDIRSSLPDLRAYQHRSPPQLLTKEQLSTHPQYSPQPHFSAQPHLPTQQQLSTQQHKSTQPQYSTQLLFSAQQHLPMQGQLLTQPHISTQPQYSMQPHFSAQKHLPMQEQLSTQPHISTSLQHSTQPPYPTQPHFSAQPQSKLSTQSQLSYSYHPSSPMTSPGFQQEEQELNDLYIQEEEQHVDHNDAEDQCVTPTNYHTDPSSSYNQQLQRQPVAHNHRYVNMHQQYSSAFDVSQTNNSHVRESPYSSIQDHYNSSNYGDVVLRRTISCNSPRASAPTRHERYSWQAENRSVQDAYSDAADIRTTPILERASLCLGSIPQLQKQIRATSELCLQASRRHMFASSADIYKLFSGQTKSPVPSSPVIQRHNVDTDLRVNSNNVNHGRQRSNDNDSHHQDILPPELPILSRSSSRMDIATLTSMVEGNYSSPGLIRSSFQQHMPTYYQQPLPSIHRQALPTNYQHDLPTNHQEASPTIYQQAMPTNHHAMTINYQQAMPTNHQQAMPTNHQQVMSPSSWTNEHFLPPLEKALYNRYGEVLAFNEDQESYSSLDEHLMDMNRSQGASRVDIHNPYEFYQAPNTPIDIQRQNQLHQRSLSADIVTEKPSYLRRPNAQHELDESLYTEALISNSGFIKSHFRRPPTAEPVQDNSMIQRPQTSDKGWNSSRVQKPQTSDSGWDSNLVQIPQTSATGWDSPRGQIPQKCNPEWDSPKVRGPQTTYPGCESDMAHRPSTSNPEWDSPRVQRPQSSDPVLDNPMAHRPLASNPGWDNPRVQRSQNSNPGWESAMIHRPSTSNQGWDSPRVLRPQATDPVLDNSMIHRPSTSNPGWDSPRVQKPQATDPVVDNPMIHQPTKSNPGRDSPRAQRPHIINPVLNNPMNQRPSNPGRDIPMAQKPHTADQILDKTMIKRPHTSNPVRPSSMLQKTEGNPVFDKPMYLRQSSGYSSETELQQIEFNAEKRSKQSSSEKKSFQQGNVQDCLLQGKNNISSDQTKGRRLTDEPVYVNIAGVQTTKELSNEGWMRNEGWMTPQTTMNEGWITQQAMTNLGWMTPQTTKRGFRSQSSKMQPVVEGMYTRSHELYANYPNDKLFSKTDAAEVVERSHLKYANTSSKAPQNTPPDFEHNNTASGSTKSNPRFPDPVLTQKQIINFNTKPVTITSVVPRQFDYEDDLNRKLDAPNRKSNYPLTPSVSVLRDYPVNPQQRAFEPRHYGTSRLTAASAAGYKHEQECVPSTVQSNRDIGQDNGGSGSQLSPRIIAQSLGTPFATNIISDDQGETLSTLV